MMLQFLRYLPESFECLQTAAAMIIRPKQCHFALQRISAYDRLTNAVRAIVPDVMNTAAAMDVELAAYNANGTTLPLLFCVPILIKDNFDAVDGKQ